MTSVASRSVGLAVLASLLSAATATAAAQAPPAAEPAQVLVLGTFHFANPGLDFVQTDVADVLSAARQAEIRGVVEALAGFRPTRIAVEQVPATAELLDSLYHAYRRGEHELSRNETEQLGFRLAALLQHPRVYPIDHRGEFPMGVLMEYAQAHDPDFLSLAQRELGRITEEANRRQRENTLGEILRLTNDPTNLAAGHALYVRTAEVGAGDNYVGAELLSRWYERNIYIFANLQRIAGPGERILVITGDNHAPILRELIRNDSRMVVVDPLAHLPPA